jgi:predicted metal-dependent hydrolase
MTRRQIQEMRRFVRFGSAMIEYQLTEGARRDLAITVHPDLSVTVVAPRGRHPEQVDARVQARGAWIVRQQLRFRDLHPLPNRKRYVSGESHRYLGRQYRLRVTEGPMDSVRVERPFLLVSVRDRTDLARVQQLVERWFRAKAEVAIAKYFEHFVKRHPQFRPLVHGVRIRRMERRWGSCSQSGTITLNPLLIHCPPACIEYVVAHELCHRRVMNHGRSFERLLSRTMPDWRSRKERLNRLG